MSDKTKLKALAAQAGGWEKLSRALWEHIPKRDKERAIKRLTPKEPPSEVTKLANPFQSISVRKSGRPIKYDSFGLSAIYITLAQMKRLVVGGEKHRDRVKNLILYAHDPKCYPILGLPPSLRDLLKEPDVRAAVPDIDPIKLHQGTKRATDVIDSYMKHLSDKAPIYSRIRELSAELSNDLSEFAEYDYQGE